MNLDQRINSLLIVEITGFTAIGFFGGSFSKWVAAKYEQSELYLVVPVRFSQYVAKGLKHLDKFIVGYEVLDHWSRASPYNGGLETISEPRYWLGISCYFLGSILSDTVHEIMARQQNPQ